jgi:hypothetical protein
MVEPPAPPASGGLPAYFRVTRGPWYGFVFALPILLSYQALVWVLQPHIINGADAALWRALGPLFATFGWQSREAVLLVVLIVGGIGSWLAHRRRYPAPADRRLHLAWFIPMLAESCFYALFFGIAVNRILVTLGLQIGRGGGPLTQVMLALGAGIYEELLFRVLIMGGLALLLMRATRFGPLVSWVCAALFSSAIFSLFHYLGAAGDVFTVESFLFRFVSGALLAALYGLRGFGIAVWTHALYDLLVMGLHGG